MQSLPHPSIHPPVSRHITILGLGLPVRSLSSALCPTRPIGACPSHMPPFGRQSSIHCNLRTSHFFKYAETPALHLSSNYTCLFPFHHGVSTGCPSSASFSLAAPLRLCPRHLIPLSILPQQQISRKHECSRSLCDPRISSRCPPACLAKQKRNNSSSGHSKIIPPPVIKAFFAPPQHGEAFWNAPENISPRKPQACRD